MDSSGGFRISCCGGGGWSPTSDADAFWQKCMQKQKNWVSLGGGHPLDLPMDFMKWPHKEGFTVHLQ